MGTQLLVPLLIAGGALAFAHDNDSERAGERSVPARTEAGGPIRDLNEREAERWLRGREVFEREVETRDGLGPAFNARSCVACHRDPVVGGSGGIEFNVVVAAEVEELDEVEQDPISRYLQRRDPDARRPRDVKRFVTQASSSTRRHEQLVANTVQTPTILGLGLLERVHEDEILGREDPHDRDGDGVRGVANRIRVGNTMRIGRFGWRADLPTLRDFTRAACGGELGLTVPDEVGFGQVTDSDDALDPEMTLEELNALAFFCGQLAQPARGGQGETEQVRAGEKLFSAVGCDTCHVPTLYGADGAIHPYTDLLLHEVAPTLPRALDRKAAPAAFRTPPLWGVSKTAPYLHDGRAKTVTEAILAHEGEAMASTQRFMALPPSKREALLAFLEDL